MLGKDRCSENGRTADSRVHPLFMVRVSNKVFVIPAKAGIQTQSHR